MAINYPNDTDVGIVRDKDGLVTSLTDATGTSSLVYYPSTWLKSLTNGAGKTVTYDYNGVGLVSTMRTPDSLNFSYGYNAINELTSAQNPNGVTVSLDYDNGGRLSRITRPGSYIEYLYNARDWITLVRNRKTDGTQLYDSCYCYSWGGWDNTGNPKCKSEWYPGAPGTGYWNIYGYDGVYRLTREDRYDANGVRDYMNCYCYDAVGNRIVRSRPGSFVTYTYDDNDKLVSGNDGSSFGYDGAGNIVSVSGPLGSWTLGYDDESRLTSVTHPGGSESFAYNALGQRMRANLNGAIYRYVYDGERVVEETSDGGSVLARHTPAGGSYYGPWLHLWRSDGSSRFPLYEGIGAARRLVDGSATITDTYTLDAFGRLLSSTGTTPNAYRYGGEWGYITDTPGSGLLQLGARFYWPELGRFVQQDPIGDGMNWYAYAGGNPVVWVDPSGLAPYNNWGDFKKWYNCGMGGAGDWVDQVLLNGATQNFGNTAGLHDAGLASDWDIAKAGANWGGRVGVTAWMGGQTVAAVGRATTMGGMVTRWGPQGEWVITGGRTPLNYGLSGAVEQNYMSAATRGLYPYGSGVTTVVPRGALRYPPGWEWIKGPLMGQRILR